MRGPNRKKTIIVLVIACVIFAAIALRPSPQVDYISEVKPIFNKNCITCHGGVKRKSGFSLLFRSEALAKNESGKPAIIPGDPGNSELIRRIELKDPEDRMPYKHPPLTEKEITTLKKWIKTGSKMGRSLGLCTGKGDGSSKSKGSFFGLIPPQNSRWENNDIDYFISQKLREEKLHPPAGQIRLLY